MWVQQALHYEQIEKNTGANVPCFCQQIACPYLDMHPDQPQVASDLLPPLFSSPTRPPKDRLTTAFDNFCIPLRQVLVKALIDYLFDAKLVSWYGPSL